MEIAKKRLSMISLLVLASAALAQAPVEERAVTQKAQTQARPSTPSGTGFETSARRADCR